MHDLNNLSIWSKATGFIFNFNKFLVLQYGNDYPNFESTLCDQALSIANSSSDLGVIRALIYHDELCTNIIHPANFICDLFSLLCLV